MIELIQKQTTSQHPEKMNLNSVMMKCISQSTNFIRGLGYRGARKTQACQCADDWRWWNRLYQCGTAGAAGVGKITIVDAIP